MNYKEHAKTEPGKDLDDLVHRIIGVAIEVHRELGPGYLESVYEEAVAVEFELAGVAFERQKVFGLNMDGCMIYPDVVCAFLGGLGVLAV